MNPVERTIREKGRDSSSVFVFPSEIAARLWMEASLELLEDDTVEAARFIAWDRFKEQAVKAGLHGKRPVSSVVRLLYTLDLARRNREKRLFSSLIPEDFAQSGAIFSPWMARLLPSLQLWENKTAPLGKGTLDEEDRDLAILKADYTGFLEREGLFEPSWQRPPLADTGLRYYILFPESIEDWDEYESLISGTDFVTPLYSKDLPRDGPNADPVVPVYTTTREELRTLALKIEGLLRAGTEARDIAVSVPDLETVAPYLGREFGIRGIPYNLRAGTALGALPAGRLFSLISECFGTGFSFSSLKALLLDRLIPWKHRDMAEGLIEFGIRNHCVTGWTEDGTLIDVWEEAFKTPVRHETPDWLLRDWYRSLRRALERMTGAEDFSEIRKCYFSFREQFLDMGLLPPADDAILARCVEELGHLILIEQQIPSLIPERPWPFFVSALAGVLYVPQGGTGGVSVFPYRVAAGTPFPHHFVIDTSQDRATVVYRQLSFLRQDKRLRRKLDDTDASASFFEIYRLCGAEFSVSLRSFAGYSTPHGYFLAGPPEVPAMTDPFAGERDLFRTGTDAELGGKQARNEDKPDRVYPVQAAGYSLWLARNLPPGRSYLSEGYDGRLPELSERVRSCQMNGENVRVSQSDLHDFSVCNARWYLSSVFGLEPMKRDAQLINENNLGLLYHSILKDLYEKIRERDRVFVPEHAAEYVAWAQDIARDATADHAEFRGPLAAPLISSLVSRIVDGVSVIIDLDAARLGGYVPEFLEQKLSLASGGIVYYGEIDRVSRNEADGTIVLIDYKSGFCYRAKDYRPQFDESGELTVQMNDFQIPIYVLLAEKSPDSAFFGKKIDEAWFASIREKRFHAVVNDAENFKFSRSSAMNREDFEPAIQALEAMAGSFARAIRELDFTRPQGLSRSECAKCDFMKVCRYLYAVGGRR